MSSTDLALAFDTADKTWHNSQDHSNDSNFVMCQHDFGFGPRQGGSATRFQVGP